MQKIWNTKKGNGPLIATAIHNGNLRRAEVADLMILSKESQLREEDPYTEIWTSVGDTSIVGLHSRFEVDLNRPREKAVYIKPEDAWGLNIWKTEPPTDLVNRSLAGYDDFYSELKNVFSEIEKEFKYFVVFDLHSYNHKRNGPAGETANPEENPEVNIGTGTINKNIWGPLVERFIADLSAYKYSDRNLDVRENIKFKGAQLSRWTHENFPNSGCSISIEFKKFFMDEWSGVPDMKQIEKIKLALQSTVPGVLEELKKLSKN
jgi:N-formylglutamate amidohydrolase